MFWALYIKDIKQAYRQMSDILFALIFYIGAVMLFPLTLGSDVALLQKIAPAVIWVLIIFAVCISINGLWQSDINAHILHDVYFSGQSLAIAVLAKISAYFTNHIIPLALVSPIAAVMLNHSDDIWVLLFTIAVAGLCLSALGVFAASMTLNAKYSDLLIIILILPLAVPITILGANILNVSDLTSPSSLMLLMIAYGLFIMVMSVGFSTLCLISYFNGKIFK